MSKLLPSKSLLFPQPNFKENLCNLGLSPFIVISQSCRNKGAILYSSYYLKLPLFSSLFILFPFYFVSYLIIFLPFFSLLRPILDCLNCALQNLLSGILNIFFFYHYLHTFNSAHISLNRWGNEGKQSHFFPL